MTKRVWQDSGRPELPPDKKRSCSVQLMVTPGEMSKLKALAEKENCRVSEIVRRAIGRELWK